MRLKITNFSLSVCLHYSSLHENVLLHISIPLESVREKAMVPHSSTLAWKSHGQRILVGCSPWGHEESDTTERLHSHFLLSCIGEGNGNPLQCSCLENPRDGGAWWAAIYGVTQSWTRLKCLSSSSSRISKKLKMKHSKYESSPRVRKITKTTHKMVSWNQE